jgi:hypothetical protein
MAEKAIGVGKATCVYCKKRGSFAFAHASGMVEKIREEWDKKGCPRVPEGIVAQIQIYNPRCE